MCLKILLCSVHMYVILQSVQMDPFLDDCVMFARKLKKLGVAMSLDILDGLPHGFLNFSQVGGWCSTLHSSFYMSCNVLCVLLRFQPNA
jgi:Esterase/lipase